MGPDQLDAALDLLVAGNGASGWPEVDVARRLRAVAMAVEPPPSAFALTVVRERLGTAAAPRNWRVRRAILAGLVAAVVIGVPLLVLLTRGMAPDPTVARAETALSSAEATATAAARTPAGTPARAAQLTLLDQEISKAVTDVGAVAGPARATLDARLERLPALRQALAAPPAPPMLEPMPTSPTTPYPDRAHEPMRPSPEPDTQSAEPAIPAGAGPGPAPSPSPEPVPSPSPTGDDDGDGDRRRGPGPSVNPTPTASTSPAPSPSPDDEEGRRGRGKERSGSGGEPED